MTDAPSSPLALIATARDDAMRAQLIREGGLALLANPDVVGTVATAALDPKSDAAQDAQALLSAALDEARMAVENDVPEGSTLIDALAATLTALDTAQPFQPVLRLTLARIYASAGLVPPPFATLNPASAPDANGTDAEMPDLSALLKPILRELGDTPVQAHGALSEMLAGLPPDAAATLVTMIVGRTGALEARLGLYWLLDPRSDIRLSAATALLTRAGQSTLPVDFTALLPTIRKWMPDDGGRAAVDAIIRQQIRYASARHTKLTVKVHRTAASLPDGAGAQSLIAAVQIGSRRGVAMAMLKQGHGVKDAFILPCASATEQKSLFARVLDEIETHDLPPDALSAALARGLSEGLSLGFLPPPGMVDMAEIWGLESLLPTAAGAADILTEIGAKDALARLSQAQRRVQVRASGNWLDRFAHLDSWFEDNGSLREAIGRARTEQGRETAVWKYLETRRDWSARILASSSAVLQAGGDPMWLSFAAVAQALLDGNSLKRIPIMEDIVATTLDAWEERHNEGSGTMNNVETVDSLLAQAGISGAYLHGYLVALAISPRAPSPEAWLTGLMGGIEFPGEGSLDRVMEIITDRANMLDHDASNSEAMAYVLGALDAEDLSDWAAGFNALVASAGRSWPSKALSADDKRLLRTLNTVAKGSEDAVLLSLLPSWIARRYALRK